MEPSPEAAAWSLRAEQWAQQPHPPERAGQSVEPVSRWSRVVPTGDYPADGVGWRTETAEWRATGARWRQTTEWRSSSGTEGWRSTTEAWQTRDADTEGFPPPTAPPTGGPRAISSTAWPEGNEDQSGTGSQSRQSSDGSYRTEQYTPPAAPGQQGDDRPAWQQFAAPPPPPWQQGPPAPAWQQTETPLWRQGPSQQQPPATGGTSPSWQQLVPPQPAEPTPGWQTRFDDGRHLVREDDRAQWRQSAAGMAGGPESEERTQQIGRRRAPEAGTAGPGGGTGWSTGSDTDNWARHTDTGTLPLFQGPGQADGSAWRDPGDASTWRTESRADGDTPDWRPRTDTPTWRRDSDIPSERTEARPRSATPSWRHDADAPEWRTETSSRGDTRDWQARTDTSWGRDADAPGRRADSAAPDWRSWTDTSSWQRDDHTRRSDSDTSDWRAQTDTPTWRRDTDVPGRRAEGRGEPAWGTQDGADADWRREDRADAAGPSWRTESRSDGRASTGAPDWHQDRDDPRPDRDDWRGERGDGRDDWRRGEDDPGTDSWAHSAADTGVIPMSWQPPSTDTGSWRSSGYQAESYAPPRRRAEVERDPYDEGDDDPYERRRTAGDPYERRAEVEGRTYGRRSDPYGRRAEIEAAPYSPARRAEIESAPDEDDWRDEGPRRAGPEDGPGTRGRDEAPLDPDVWRRDPEPQSERENWRMAPLDDARTPAWRQELQPEREGTARGTASYREGSTGDWRRELAVQSDLADGESKRYGTSDFVSFRPSGAISTGAAAVPAARPAPEQPARAREQLLVGNGAGSTGSRWQDPPSTQWPPRPVVGYEDPGTATGSYERRPISTLPETPGRQTNLLEPDEDDFETDTGGPLAAVGYTVIWYGVPVVLFVLYMLFLNGSQQAHALSTLAGAAPQFGLSLVLSMVVAVGLRWASGSWKAASVGLAAAVLGGGLATVLASAITGNSLS